MLGYNFFLSFLFFVLFFLIFFIVLFSFNTFLLAYTRTWAHGQEGMT